MSKLAIHAKEAGTVQPLREVPPFGLLPDDAFDRDALALAEESAGIGVWSIDLTTSRVRGTAQFFRILGLPPTTEPVPVDVVRALRHPDDRARVIAGFQEALEGGNDTYEIEYRIVRPDGNVRWIFGRGRVIRGGDGMPLRYSGVDLDITDRKATEAALAEATRELARMNQELEQRVRDRTAALEREAMRRTEAELRLHQAQKMEAVGQLTGGIAHDFNNVLQVIMGNVEIARLTLTRDAGAGGREIVLRALETAHKASQTAKQTVQRLLAFSRLQPLVPSELDLNLLVGDLTDMFARVLGEQIRIRTRLAPGLWPTFADRNQLESVLLNLVVNARDAMPQGGELAIETANLEVTGEDGPDLPPARYVCLTVADNDHGIAAEHLPRVFEPFFTTKETGKGSGLGLSMVYGFVKQSGGHIRIESDVGKGTTVRIFLQRSTRSGAAVRDGMRDGSAHGARPAARDGECVLLVEDDEEVRRFGIAALEGLGYRVLAASDAADAMRVLDGDAGAQVDLLFTDIVLPGGTSGRDLADATHAKRPDLPVLFASGYTRNVVVQDGHGTSGARLLQKPYSIDTLAAAVRNAIDGAAGRRAMKRSD
jgi:PAS domain S-box-containing protein